MKTGFGSEFKVKNSSDYPKLSLEKDEKARVCVVGDPETEWVHTLREIILENGKPVMEEREFRGRTTQRPKAEFRGKYICLGEADVLQRKGVDPDNCPACKASVENGAAVEGPKPRFVVHIFKYATKKGSFTVQEPFQVEVMAWEFAESRFNALCDIQEEHGNLNNVDLILGPCESQMYQKFSISTGGKCQWANSADNKKKAVESYQNNKSDDLTPLLGRKVSSSELSSQIHGIMSTWNTAFGRPGEMPEPESDPGFANDLSSLIDEPKEEKSDPWAVKSDDDSDDNDVESLDNLIASFAD